MNKKLTTTFAAMLLALAPVQAQTEDMATFRTWAQTPPMGWNSWDCYYNLTGQKVTPNGKGIYIHNNKKVVIK